MGETITRQEMVREVADRLDATPELIAARMRSGGQPRAERAPAPAGRREGEPDAAVRQRREPTQEERREAMMLALCMDAPETAAPYLARLGSDHFTSPILQAVFERVREHPSDPLDGLGDSDSDLINAISRLQALDHEPATKDDLQFRWMLPGARSARSRPSPSGRARAHRAGRDAEGAGKLADAISSVEARGFGGAVPGPAAR